MNKLLLLISIYILLQSTGVHSQNIIAVQNGNNVTLYNQLDSAINQANNGDTIYIPGGNYFGDLHINKEVHIIGTGYNQDSMVSMIPTRIFGPTFFHLGSDSTTITGIFFASPITRYNTELVSSVIITRSFLAGGFNLNLTNWTFIQNVIEGMTQAVYAEKCNFFNNIFSSLTNFRDLPKFNDCQFRNNIFLHGVTGNRVSFPIGSTNSLIENNIFLQQDYGSVSEHCANSIFNNNLFVENWLASNCPNCLGSNNIISQEQTSIFINQVGNNYNNLHSYHLKSSSPGKNAGTDGKDIGIYGGLFPWKDGALPSIPHVILKQISNTTDQNGNLQINMVVKAQNN